MANSDRLSSPRQAGPACGGTGSGNYPDLVDGKCIHLPVTLENFVEDVDEGRMQGVAEELYQEHIKKSEAEAVGLIDMVGGTEGVVATLIEGIHDGANAIVDAIADLLESTPAEAEASAVLAGASDVAFKEQCFLLAYMKELSAYKKELDKEGGYKPLPYAAGNPHNASLLLDGDPFGFANKITMHSSQKAFFNMETKDISKLQPMIRLFKIIEDENQEERQQEISFDSYLTPDDLSVLKDKTNRGVGVGIKSFTFSYEASNPFAIKKSIKAKLSLFANTFQELLRVRTANDGSFYKYIDLALKTGTSETADLARKSNNTNPQRADEVYDNLDKLNFRLKAVVGWALPGESSVSGDLRNAIYDSYITLNLTPTVHEFNLDDQGRVGFDINYLAYVEDFFDQQSFNILGDAGIAARIIDRKMKFKSFNIACDSDSISKLKEETKNQIQDDKVSSYQTLMADLLASDRMYSIAIPFDKIGDFLDKAPFYPFESFQISQNIDVGLVQQIIDDAKDNLTEGGPCGPAADDPGDRTGRVATDIRDTVDTAKGQAEENDAPTGVATQTAQGQVTSNVTYTRGARAPVDPLQ